MYYKIINKLTDAIRAYKKVPIDSDRPAFGVVREELRPLWINDYFTIEGGNIKLISGRFDRSEFDGVEIEYPKDIIEISLFLKNNRESILPMSKAIFEKDYEITYQRNYLVADCLELGETIDDMIIFMGNPPNPKDKKLLKRLCSERERLCRKIRKLDKKAQLLLSPKSKQRKSILER